MLSVGRLCYSLGFPACVVLMWSLSKGMEEGDVSASPLRASKMMGVTYGNGLHMLCPLNRRRVRIEKKTGDV